MVGNTRYVTYADKGKAKATTPKKTTIVVGDNVEASHDRQEENVGITKHQQQPIQEANDDNNKT